MDKPDKVERARKRERECVCNESKWIIPMATDVFSNKEIELFKKKETPRDEIVLNNSNNSERESQAAISLPCLITAPAVDGHKRCWKARTWWRKDVPDWKELKHLSIANIHHYRKSSDLIKLNKKERKASRYIEMTFSYNNKSTQFSFFSSSYRQTKKNKCKHGYTTDLQFQNM